MKKRIIVLLTVGIMLISTLAVNAGGEYSTYRDYFPFEDVLNNSWYTPAVEFCYVNSYMKGVSNDHFDPSAKATREQMMMIIANMTGEDISHFTKTSFTDVKEGEWYTSAIAWAEERNYTKGIGNGKFGLGKTITREETVTLFYNYVTRENDDLSKAEDLSSFEDAESVSDWAYEAMLWACETKVVQGNNKKIDPKGLLTRAQAAQLIYNVQLNCLHNYHEHDFSDATCTEPSKCISKEGLSDECELILAPAKGHRVDIDKMCEEFTQCNECGAAVFSPLGHDYSGATCTEPMTCTRCGKQKGDALGHTSEKDMCLRCGKEFFKNSYEKLLYFLNNKGITNSNTKYFYTTVTYNNGATADQYITYDSKDIYLENIFKFVSSKDTVKVKLKLAPNEESYTYTFEYYKSNSVVYSGSGTLKASEFAKGKKLTLSSYNGNSAQKPDVEEILSNSMVLNLDATSYLLTKETNLTVADLGFVNFK